MQIYNIPAYKKFIPSLLEGFFNKFGKKIDYSDFIIFLPSKRACKLFYQELLKTRPNILIMPKILAIGEIEIDQICEIMEDNKDFIYETLIKISNSISDHKKQVILVDIIKKLEPSLSFEHVIGFSNNITDLLANLQREKIHYQELKKCIPDDLYEFWDGHTDLLFKILDEWENTLLNLNLLDPITKRNQVISALSHFWTSNEPKYEIVIAGTTASQTATLELINTLKNYDKCYLVLPHFDNFLNKDQYDSINTCHPMYMQKRLIEKMGYNFSEIVEWFHQNDFEQNFLLRSKFLNMMFSSSSYIAQQGINLADFSPHIQQIFGNMELVEVNDLQTEAEIIAMKIRINIDEYDKIGIITHNSELTQRIIKSLSEYDIITDNSEGVLLVNTESINFMSLIIEIMDNFTAEKILALISHPLFLPEQDLGVKHSFNNKFLEFFLEKNRDLKTNLAKFKTILTIDEIKILKAVTSLKNYHARLIKIKNINLKVILHTHKKLGLKFSERRILKGENGKFFLEIISKIILSANFYESISINDYNILFKKLCSYDFLRPNVKEGQKVVILTPIEARFHNFDLAILADLNENSWPKIETENSWINNHIRQNLNMMPIEKTIGQSAHDFFCLLNQPNIFLTRSKKIDNSPTIRSRFLDRIYLAAKNFGVDNFFQTEYWLKLHEKLLDFNYSMNQKKEIISDLPRINSKLERISVTQIDKLNQNPFMFYVDNILKYSPKNLDDLDKYADFGNFIHKLIELFFLNNIIISDYDSAMSFFEKEANKYLNALHIHSFLKKTWHQEALQIMHRFLEHKDFFYQEGQEIHTEVSGSIYLKKYDIHLFGRADLIIYRANKAIIIDFKTGSRIPTKQDVENGKSLQLPLLAFIQNNSGFPKKCQTAELIYCSLRNEENKFFSSFTNIEFLSSQAEEKLYQILDLYINQKENLKYEIKEMKTSLYKNHLHLLREKFDFF